MRKIFLPLLFVMILPFKGFCAAEDGIEHKVMATVNGKAITSYEVMVKMDELFELDFPEYKDMDPMRAEFYHYSWKRILADIVERELVLADARDKKLPVSDGDIREELERAFGPDIYGNLDAKGLTYEEAWELMREEIMVRRMMQYRVNTKALQKVRPKALVELYEEYLKDNPPEKILTYQVLTVRCKTQDELSEVVKASKKLNKKSFRSMADLYDTLLLETAHLDGVSLNLGEPVQNEFSKISAEFRQELEPLNEGEISPFSLQKSRTSKVDVLRAFALSKQEIKEPVPFKELQRKLEEFVMHKEITQENKHYIEKLKKQFPINQIAENESPFSKLKVMR